MKQAQNTNLHIVNKNGQPFDLELSPDSREQIATNIASYFLNSEENSIFLSNAINHLQQHSKAVEITDNQIQISGKDPEFQNFCILYATQKVMDLALDENIQEAYILLTELTNAAKYKFDHEVALDEDGLNELENYYAQAPELQLAKQICDIQLEINATMSGESGKCLTSFQANRIQEKFDEMVPYLNLNQCAAGYYNISIIHRALLGEKDTYDPTENSAEKECLQKVLEYSEDYKRIDYCVNRLGSDYKNKGLIRSAYRRALTSATTDNDFYKINMALAQCYADDYQPRMGFNYGTGSLQEAEDKKLERAEMYYQDALEYAPLPEKLNVLKNIAKMQLKQHKMQDWAQTRTTMAMKYMQGSERCHALMGIAEKMPHLQEAYLDRVIYEADHAKNLSKSRKNMIIYQASSLLRPIYESNNYRDGLDYLDKMANKYAKAQNVDILNPLAQYKKRGNSK